MKQRIKKRHIFLLLTAVLLGLLIALQAKTFTNIGDVLNRNGRSDIFREIQVLKTTNDNLSDEVKSLEKQLEKLSNNQDALASVEDEILKYQSLSGDKEVTGPGINLTIEGQINSIWLIDIVNELLAAGSEAISVNGIRLVDSTIGFDTIPNGQILLNSVIINSPYKIEAIGERDVLEMAISQPNGILERMEKSLENVSFEVQEKDLLEMDAVR
ncbi:DUF881 domain-containing protein [Candidatus Peregrinibacteria bacterium]|nr:DUF881 domain-containing protein [Candidatus Peregrinibacteria bacterium]